MINTTITLFAGAMLAFGMSHGHATVACAGAFLIGVQVGMWAALKLIISGRVVIPTNIQE